MNHVPKFRDLRCLRVRAFERVRLPGGDVAWVLAQGWIFYGESRERAQRRLARQRAADPALRAALRGGAAIRSRLEWVC